MNVTFLSNGFYFRGLFSYIRYSYTSLKIKLADVLRYSAKKLAHSSFIPKVVNSDDYLIELLQQKNPEAISELYDKYASAIFGAIFSEINNKAQAESILEECFVYVWHNFAIDYLNTTRLLLWLLKISKHITTKRLTDLYPAADSDKTKTISSDVA